LIVGVTGGIGSGKSVFSRALRKAGACLIDADRIARKIVRQDIVKSEIRNTFGHEFFDKINRLQRRKLGRVVFADPVKLQLLNTIIKPHLISEIKKKIRHCMKRRSAQ
jgi:dephospho-CoA kinase